ncbi:MAG: malto-oligosyltrehalose trehalohydrolase [Chloroflexota bacterium]
MKVLTVGSFYLGRGRCRFRVWAPLAKRVELHLLSPEDRLVALCKADNGYHEVVAEGVRPGARYLFRLDGGKERPDPASRFQSEGVHGPSGVVDLTFPWQDSAWRGLPLEEYVIYELHTGTFTRQGTFRAIVPHLERLKKLGITAIELMPVAQFPGTRNWGYDGVYPFAVQNSYGGPRELQALVNACHTGGLAVVMDVVYNHLGPEGNYTRDYGHYFTTRYTAPWGEALNFDGPFSDEVRNFFIENAVYWVTEFHVDALRLDAIHAIIDKSPLPFVEELATEVHRVARRLNRRVQVIAETHLNDAWLLRSKTAGGSGLDAQWNDDFHHSLHAILTGEREGYYLDFGKASHLAKALQNGYVYTGEYAPFWKRRRGVPSKDIPSARFVVFSQNHDHIGNRMLGERLCQLVDFESTKLAASATLLSPCVPLLFMGEEYGETAPFLYFVSHFAPDLINAVRKGRKEEFESFAWAGEPPDPQSEGTYLQSKLNPRLRSRGRHGTLNAFYRELLRLRKTIPTLSVLDKKRLKVAVSNTSETILIHRWHGQGRVVMAMNFGKHSVTIEIPADSNGWQKCLDSADRKWAGPGSDCPETLPQGTRIKLKLRPRSVVLYLNQVP